MNTIEQKFGIRNYKMNTSQLKSIKKNIGNSEDAPKTKRKDVYAEMPVRALGYTNEIGEALRPVIGSWAWASWVPAIAYIGADIADKYNQDEYGEQKPSAERAGKQATTQILASVFMPTAAVKLGQNTVNMLSAFAPSGISLNHQEKISNLVLDAMDKGEHKNFMDKTGVINKEAFTNSLVEKMAEQSKHKKASRSLLKPFSTIMAWIKNPQLKKPKQENISAYTSKVVDRLFKSREQLAAIEKPNKLSEKSFKKFSEAMAKAGDNFEQRRGITYHYIKKMEKSKMFNNKMLLSAGGFIALALLAKPIDKFVENVVIKKAVEPTIAMFKGKNKNKENIGNIEQQNA